MRAVGIEPTRAMPIAVLDILSSLHRETDCPKHNALTTRPDSPIVKEQMIFSIIRV